MFLFLFISIANKRKGIPSYFYKVTGRKRLVIFRYGFEINFGYVRDKFYVTLNIQEIFCIKYYTREIWYYYLVRNIF